VSFSIENSGGLVWLARVGGKPFLFSIFTETVAGWFGLARTGFGTETFVSKKKLV
jgi:hypothetical protein